MLITNDYKVAEDTLDGNENLKLVERAAFRGRPLGPEKLSILEDGWASEWDEFTRTRPKDPQI